MIPDLGKYAEAVVSSYAISIALLVVLVAASLHRGQKARRALAEIEQNRSANG